LLQQISSSTNHNFIQVSLCFYCERFFCSSHALPCTAWLFLLPLLVPVAFGTLLPTNPARVLRRLLLYQSTKVPPDLTLAGCSHLLTHHGCIAAFAKHEQQFPLLFPWVAVQFNKCFTLCMVNLRIEAIITIPIKKCAVGAGKDKCYLWISLAHTPHTKEAFSQSSLTVSKRVQHTKHVISRWRRTQISVSRAHATDI
jgi:hypothetical protein